jgi:CHC2 zinc finger/TIR domain
MQFSPKLLDEIRARVPVSQVVSRKVALKRAGREMKGLSPFKQERTPSFFVNDHKASWFDFSSGQNGDIFKFVMLTEGLSFSEAVEQLAQEAGVPISQLDRTSRGVSAGAAKGVPLRVSEKLALIDKVGRELQARFRYEEIDAFLAEYGLKGPNEISVNSKWVYAKAALTDAPNDVLLGIAEELDVEIPGTKARTARPPRNWVGATDFRLFVSHISQHKDKAARLKGCLASFAINAFVAHDDIHPTVEWQSEIERALGTMDAFLAMHTDGFSESCWTQQEIGYAVCRRVKIISLKMGDEDPAGFISKHQALPRQGRSAEAIAKHLNELLADDPATGPILQAAKTARGIHPDDDIPF